MAVLPQLVVLIGGAKVVKGGTLVAVGAQKYEWQVDPGGMLDVGQDPEAQLIVVIPHEVLVGRGAQNCVGHGEPGAYVEVG